jgi:hypothetical protein
MKGKSYSYSAVKGSYGVEVNITPDMLDRIKDIDQQFLMGILRDQESSTSYRGGWVGKCPFCSSTKRRASQKSYKPAYLNPSTMGYVFHCCSCEASMTAYKLLLAVQGGVVAEEYLITRWAAGELCGAGFNCPLPSRVREQLLSEKEQRKAAYKKEYELKKARNYVAKYGKLPG